MLGIFFQPLVPEWVLRCGSRSVVLVWALREGWLELGNDAETAEAEPGAAAWIQSPAPRAGSPAWAPTSGGAAHWTLAAQ